MFAKRKTRLGRGIHAPLAAFWRAGRSLVLTMNQLGLIPAVIRPLLRYAAVALGAVATR